MEAACQEPSPHRPWRLSGQRRHTNHHRPPKAFAAEGAQQEAPAVAFGGFRVIGVDDRGTTVSRRPK